MDQKQWNMAKIEPNMGIYDRIQAVLRLFPVHTGPYVGVLIALRNVVPGQH